MGVFDNIQKNIEDISEFLNLSIEEKNLLLNHKKINKATIKLGEKEYPAWRIVHNDALGPGKGGIRFHPGVSEDEVKSLSFWMSLKTSLADLPYGGAKGGVRVNPKELSESEIEELSRSYIREFHEFIGMDKDIPAPDVYTNPQIMAWMLDEFEKIKRRHEPGMITGKPIELGGCAVRSDSTSKGGKIVLDLLIDKLQKKPEDLSVAIQGFGNAGMNIAKMLEKEGYKIVACSDSKGGVYNKEGLDIQKLIEIKKNKGRVGDYPDAENITNKEILELDTDILILAALENQISEENAENIKAKYILELANGPITYEADKILYKKDILVIPDILANSGGVIVSYAEWVQNKTGNIFSKEFIENVLKEKITSAFHRTYELYQKENELNMRNAAYVLAIKRILSAEKLRGNL